MFYPTLHKAIEKKDVEDVISFINQGADVNERDPRRQTPLHIAIDVENEEIVELLINSKANLSLENTSYNTPLFSAILKGNSSIVKLLLDAGAKSGKEDWYETLLEIAAYTDSVPLVKFLISREVDINTGSLSRALINACQKGNLEVAKLLIESGAQVMHIPTIKNRAEGFQIAAEINNIPLLELFLSYNVDVNHRAGVCNQTALHCAATANKGDSHYEVIQKLLNRGANVNLQDESGRTPLHYLFEKSSTNIIQLFLKQGAEVNVADKVGQTPLFLAVRTEKTDLVRLLIEYGSKVNYVNPENGTTALHCNAHFERGIEITKSLLESEANINIMNFEGETPLTIKLSRSFIQSKTYHDSVEFLMKYSDVNTINLKKNDILLNINTGGRAWKILLKHIEKLQTLKLLLHPSLLNSISNNPELDHFFNKCTRELLIAKNTKPDNSWITYFDLLVANKRMLKNYVGNQDLVNDVNKSDFNKKFRIYGPCIFKKVSKGITRRDLFDKSTI